MTNTNTIITNLTNKELEEARNIAIAGIHAGLAHLGLTSTYEKDFLDGVVLGKIPVSNTFTSAALKVVETKIANTDITNAVVKTVDGWIEDCNEDKDKLEAMALWMYDVDLKKNKSFDNMVLDLKAHIDTE